MTDRTPLWSTVLLLLGAHAFGLNLHNIIHEFGHAVAVLVQGGKMTGFYFHPFGACLNFSTYVPNHILLYAGGAFIAPALRRGAGAGYSPGQGQSEHSLRLR